MCYTIMKSKYSRIAQPRMIQIVAYARRDQCSPVPPTEQPVESLAVREEDEHHLGHAEAVAKVVERIVAVGGLYPAL